MKKINILINQFLNKFGYKISKSNNINDLIKIFKYKDYEEYKKTQIHYNKKKLKMFGQMKKL